MATAKLNDGHGGNVFKAARELGVGLDQILDFSASINPLGLPGSVRQAAVESIDVTVHYPEIDAASLVDALAEYHDVSQANLLAGNGSTALIYQLARCFRPKKALVVTPSFSEYARALKQVGCAVVECPLAAQDDFRFDVETVLQCAGKKTEIVFVANPGNPSGVGIDRRQIQKLADALPETTLLVVDEAFVDFCPERSVIEEVDERPNLIVLRSLTKFYAIPGLRAGYLAGSVGLVRRMTASCEPWALSTPAVAAARACLRETDYREQTLKLIPQWRHQLSEGLKALQLQVYPSSANYLLIRLPHGGRTSGMVCRVLHQQGILVRDCSNFAALDEHCIRVAVRGVQDNLRLLNGMKGVLL